MDIYVGWAVRASVTVPKGARIEAMGEFLENDLTGCPAGFAFTVFQQVISFCHIHGLLLRCFLRALPFHAQEAELQV
eukprot:11085069-Lingulodinium_polyedra.AAC.1